MADLTLHISGTSTRDGRTEIISTTHVHMEGVLAFAWKTNAENGDRYKIGCASYGNWSVQRFAAALKQMEEMLGRERFAEALIQMLEMDKYEVKEDGQDEQAGVD